MPAALDIVGDIHGQLGALQNLGAALGYDADWSHPDGRVLLFLGDLIDRGDASLEVVELVARLVAERKAMCLMGNHEYNLVAYHLRLPGYERPKHSNHNTITHMQQEPTRWHAALAFLAELPIAIELPDLRIVHACWHGEFVENLKQLLPALPPKRNDAVGQVEARVILGSPFINGQLRTGLTVADDNPPHEVLIKGPEIATEPFNDADGKRRYHQRATWWNDLSVPVPRDKPLVFGHYWNLPPVTGQFAPPHASGTRELREWTMDLVKHVPPTGRMPLIGDVACVDFNGALLAGRPAILGALRWPEREIVWAGV